MAVSPACRGPGSLLTCLGTQKGLRHLTRHPMDEDRGAQRGLAASPSHTAGKWGAGLNSNRTLEHILCQRLLQRDPRAQASMHAENACVQHIFSEKPGNAVFSARGRVE